jgi:hypothetical protein
MTIRIAQYYRFQNLRIPWTDAWVYTDDLPKEKEIDGITYYFEPDETETDEDVVIYKYYEMEI